MPMIDRLLRQLDLSVRDLDAVAVTQGPGSFTGLRIGMATAKGLAQGADLRLIAVPTLDCMAYNLVQYPGFVCPILNAQKRQVYTALYRSAPDGADAMQRLSAYQAIGCAQLAEALRAREEVVWFLGDCAEFAQTLRDALGARCRFAPAHQMLPRAGALALLAERRAARGDYDDLLRTMPVYIRKSEAEVQWEARQKQGAQKAD